MGGAEQRNPELEARIIGTRGGSDYDVYADWLQTAGNPIGELIAVQRKLEGGRDHQLLKAQNDLIKSLGLPPKDHATYGFRWGLFDWVRIENSRWTDDSFEATSIARQLFDTPLAAGLRELRTGVLRWSHNHVDVPAVLDEAARHPFARGVERLHLGDVGDSVDMAHHAIGDVGRRVSAAFPNLRELTLHSGEQPYNGPNTFEIDGLDLPALETLTIETCSLSKKRLRALFEANLPKVEWLSLWFGSIDYGADTTVDDLLPLLDGQVFSNVTELGLRNAEFTNDIAAALPASDVAKRVMGLDLSMGTLDDAGAALLADGAKAFEMLVRLDVRDNFLTAEGIRRLRTAFGEGALLADDQKEIDPTDPDLRYASVWE